jgi:hypothetical protein
MRGRGYQVVQVNASRWTHPKDTRVLGIALGFPGYKGRLRRARLRCEPWRSSVSEHPIRIRCAQRPDIDPELLAQLVLSMAHQLAEEAAASGAAVDTGDRTTPKRPTALHADQAEAGSPCSNRPQG